MRPIRLLFSVLIIATSFAGCKKVSDSNNSSNYTIAYSGCSFAGGQITFSSTYAVDPVGVSSVWDMGDGTRITGTTTSIVHTYNSPGNYLVQLTLNGQKMSRAIQITAGPYSSPYTAHMAGLKTWKGTAEGDVTEFGSELLAEPISLDTALTLTVVNPGIIQLPLFTGGITLSLTNVDTVNQLLTFSSCTVNSASVSYYYRKDSIVYSNYWEASVGHNYEEFIIHTP